LYVNSRNGVSLPLTCCFPGLLFRG
jgi:hypothetical protein